MKEILAILFACAFFSLHAEQSSSLKQIADERKAAYEQKPEEEKQAEIEQYVIKERKRKENENKRAWRDFLSSMVPIISDDIQKSAP